MSFKIGSGPVCYEIKKVVDWDVITIIENSKVGKYRDFKMLLTNDNGKYSAKDITELFNKVLASLTEIKENNCYEIKYKIDELKYDLKTMKDIMVDPLICIQFFKDLYNMDLKQENDQIYGILDKNTIFPKAKPVFNEPKVTELPEHFKSLCTSLDYCDVNIDVKDALIPGHKSILSQLPYFKNHFNENPSQNIALKQFSGEAMIGLLTFLYSGKVDPAPKLETQLELLKLCAEVKCEDLQSILYKQIFDLIRGEKLVTIKNIFMDPCLEDLLHWNLVQSVDTINFSNFSQRSHYEIYAKLRDLGIKGKANDKCLVELEGKIKLDDDFIYICGDILTKKDSRAKEFIEKVVLSKFKSELMKEDACRKAFTELRNDFSF